MVEDATHDQCHENGIDGSSCDGKMISVPAIPGYFGRGVRHLMCQKHIHNYWGALAWYEQENNLERIMGNGSKLRFNDMSNSHHSAETFASECESCDEESDGGVYECDCCYQVYCENCFEETVDAGHSPYRGSIDEWMSITKNPRIEETSTGSSWTGGAICGNCAAEIETELYDLTPIPELMEDEQGTANLASESKELKRTSCCCGATESSPCACMYEGVMKCSANAPMCPCYKALAEKNAESPTTKSKSKHITEIVLITALIGGVIASMKRK